MYCLKETEEAEGIEESEGTKGLHELTATLCYLILWNGI